MKTNPIEENGVTAVRKSFCLGNESNTLATTIALFLLLVGLANFGAGCKCCNPNDGSRESLLRINAEVPVVPVGDDVVIHLNAEGGTGPVQWTQPTNLPTYWTVSGQGTRELTVRGETPLGYSGSSSLNFMFGAALTNAAIVEKELKLTTKARPLTPVSNPQPIRLNNSTRVVEYKIRLERAFRSFGRIPESTVFNLVLSGVESGTKMKFVEEKDNGEPRESGEITIEAKQQTNTLYLGETASWVLESIPFRMRFFGNSTENLTLHEVRVVVR